MTTETQAPKVTLEDLNYFWTKSGLPCFYADRDNIQDIVEDLGFSIYYLICTLAEDIPPAKTTTTTTYTTGGSAATPAKPTVEYTTSIVKVVNNIVGRSVSVVQDDISDLSVVRETGEYNMPPIPRVIVDKLDEFFRLVDAQHGTESIVLLTFDPSKSDSSGWGVLVPDQTNTAVHCNYNPDSIVAEKPDHVLIVGSVHSHPGMAAYASGTDHADQADFDGVHITYGWQKSVNGGATQYHIEMQMAGSSWTLNPDDVFETFIIEKEPDPDVVQWSSKVKKAYPPHQQAGVTALAPQQLPTQTLPNSIHTASTVLGTPKGGIPDVPTQEKYILVAEIDPAASVVECPSCYHTLTDDDLHIGYCKVCDMALVSALAQVSDILDEARWYLTTRNIVENTAIYLWAKDAKTKEELVMKIGYSYPEKSVDIPKIEVEDISDNFIDEEPFDPDLTICCGTDVYNLQNCRCERPVFYEDYVDFEQAHSEIDIYDYNSECYNCKFFSAAGCLEYVSAVVDYAVNRTTLTSKIYGCPDFVSIYKSKIYDEGYPIDIRK